MAPDTGARISVCGTSQARKLGLLDRMVLFQMNISGSCEPILSRNAALQLAIIQFNKKDTTFHPLLMIEKDCESNLQDILACYPANFNVLGKLQGQKVKLHCYLEVKPVDVPAHSFPYHLRERAQKAINGMIEQDVIVEHGYQMQFLQQNMMH